MLFVHLYDLRLFGYHGVYPEEQRIGGIFIVNVSVGWEPPASVIRDLDETIDYTHLYQLVKERMDTATPLLETLAMDITAIIRERFSQVTKISISIKKLHPPVNNFEGSLGVSFEWSK